MDSDDDSSTVGIKRKRSDEVVSVAPSAKQLVLQEIDLELALKDRIAVTVQSRITWALLLQEALNKELNVTTSSGNDFRDAALTALDAIDTPCSPIFQREPIRGFDGGSAMCPEPPLLRKATDNFVRNHGARNRPLRTNQVVHKLLFVRNNATNPPLVARLQCPDCARWDFSTTQGFLNHCRIRHQREYGGHDECIQNCSVIVSEEEREWVIQNGTELTEVGIPSLRRLFEIAVSGKSSSIFPPSPSIPTRPANEIPPSEGKEMLTDSTHLSRTLGLHKDTPALAPFLGRTAQRRCINVIDQEEPPDIDSESSTSVVKWRMPFSHRNCARPELDDDPDPLNFPKGDEPQETKSELIQPNSTRFHIVARVVITDRSRWLAPSQRSSLNPHHTHRWMISIDSPSYSLHVTTILASVTVSCLTDPPPSTLVNPVVITAPPFIVMGTTDQPFLAQVTLTWTGPHNSPLELEHWVETDPMKTGMPILGEEQFIDIELDRKTELLPARANVIRWRDQELSTHLEDSTSSKSETPLEVHDYEQVLLSLLPSVPMTMKDDRHRSSNSISRCLGYMLVPTPAQFQKLVIGRQKAIEWGRGRALHAAYSEHRRLTSPNLLPLTVGDVYYWLEGENLFPRSKGARLDELHDPKSTTQTPSRFCPSCGLPSQNHDNVSEVDSASSCGLGCFRRTLFSQQLPLANITNVSRCGFIPAAPPVPLIPASNRELVHTANPTLTIFVKELILSLKLPTFEMASVSRLADDPVTRVDQIQHSRDEIERHLAPYALISLVITQFVHHLISRTLEASDGVQTFADPLLQSCGRVITPSHVFQSLHNDLFHRRGLKDPMIGLALARLGMVTERSGNGQKAEG